MRDRLSRTGARKGGIRGKEALSSICKLAYKDLVDERSAIFDTLMKLDCIPAGMESFPAFDEEQLEYIRRIIDDIDYYVLIIAGRYESLTEGEISFTEKEYDYAVYIGIPILAFIHAKPDSIPVGMTDKNDKLYDALQSFIEKARRGRIVQHWESSSDLSLKVTQALTQTMRARPGIGWVRGNVPASPELLREINDLRKQLEIKSDELNKLKAEERNFITDNLAPLDEIFELGVHLNSPDQGSLVNKYGITWEKIFMIVGPFLTASRKQFEINKKLLDYISEQYSFDQYYISINSEDSDTIKLQLAAYGFIEIVTTQLKDSQKTVEDLKLSPLGMKILLDLKTHKGGVKAES